MKQLVVFVLMLLVQLPAPASEDHLENRKDSTGTPWGHFRQRPKDKKGKPAFSPWEYMKQEEQYITAKAGLTIVEEKTVFPLLHQMKDKQREIDGKIFRMFEKAENDRLTESESKALVKEIRQLSEEKQDIENTYNRKMLATLSARKFLKFKQAEMSFGRFMLHKMFMDKNKNFGSDCPPKDRKGKK